MRGTTRRATRFGAALSQARTGAGLTQVGLAEKAGVQRSYIQELEYGGRRPSSEKAAAIAKKLELPPWHFEQSLAEDRIESVCPPSAITMVVVGLEHHAASLSDEEWRAIRERGLRSARVQAPRSGAAWETGRARGRF